MNNNKVLLILTDGFEEIEAFGTFAILRRSNIDVDIYSLKRSNIEGRYGLKLNDYKVINEDNNFNLDSYNALFIAGGPEYVELEASKEFKDIILDFYSKQKLIAAICAGPTILGHLGLLKNKKYTCFKSMNEDFGGTYIDTYVVQDDNIISGISASATIDFAFKIVEYLKGKTYAEEVKNSIYYYDK